MVNELIIEKFVDDFVLIESHHLLPYLTLLVLLSDKMICTDRFNATIKKQKENLIFLFHQFLLMPYS